MKSEHQTPPWIGLGPGAVVLSDGDLVLAVRCILQWQASLPLGAITVRVRHGWVAMHGEIDGDFPHQKIGAAIRSLAGVRGLHDHVMFRSRDAAVPILQAVRHRRSSELVQQLAQG